PNTPARKRKTLCVSFSAKFRLESDVVRRWILDTPWLDAIVRATEERVAPRGFYVLGATLVFAALAVNLRSNQVYMLFAAAAGVLVASVLFSMDRRPRVRVHYHPPSRATAG